MVVQALGISKFVSERVFCREHCGMVSNGMAVKDVHVLAECVEDVVLVDNSICSLVLNPRNGIYVPSFNGNDKDNELLKLGQFLLSIHESSKCLCSSLYSAGYNLEDLLKLGNT